RERSLRSERGQLVNACATARRASRFRCGDDRAISVFCSWRTRLWGRWPPIGRVVGLHVALRVGYAALILIRYLQLHDGWWHKIALSDFSPGRCKRGVIRLLSASETVKKRRPIQSCGALRGSA